MELRNEDDEKVSREIQQTRDTSLDKLQSEIS